MKMIATAFVLLALLFSESVIGGNSIESGRCITQRDNLCGNAQLKYLDSVDTNCWKNNLFVCKGGNCVNFFTSSTTATTCKTNYHKSVNGTTCSTTCPPGEYSNSTSDHCKPISAATIPPTNTTTNATTTPTPTPTTTPRTTPKPTTGTSPTSPTTVTKTPTVLNATSVPVGGGILYVFGNNLGDSTTTTVTIQNPTNTTKTPTKRTVVDDVIKCSNVTVDSSGKNLSCIIYATGTGKAKHIAVTVNGVTNNDNNTLFARDGPSVSGIEASTIDNNVLIINGLNFGYLVSVVSVEIDDSVCEILSVINTKIMCRNHLQSSSQTVRTITVTVDDQTTITMQNIGTENTNNAGNVSKGQSGVVSDGTIAGIVIGAIVGLLVIAVIIAAIVIKKKSNNNNNNNPADIPVEAHRHKKFGLDMFGTGHSMGELPNYRNSVSSSESFSPPPVELNVL